MAPQISSASMRACRQHKSPCRQHDSFMGIVSISAAIACLLREGCRLLTICQHAVSSCSHSL